MTRRNLHALLGGVAVLLLLVVTIVRAALPLTSNPLGEPLPPCPGNCTAFIVGLFDGPRQFTTTGTATFTTVANREANPEAGTPASTELRANAWSGTGVTPDLGAVNWEFDLTREEVPTSTFVANQLEADFPATGDLYFHIRGTIGSVPGTVYRSRTPLHVRSTNITSFNPVVNESFTLVEDVVFEDVNNPDDESATFTLSTLTLWINAES